MDRVYHFEFNGKTYNINTIVKINAVYQKYVGFHSILKFTGYIVDEDVYCFSSIGDNWEIYKLSKAQVSLYVETIFKSYEMKRENNATAKYIDGIISAWIWYILTMIFALFLNGTSNVIVTWLIATFIFFNWRHKKIKGG